MRKEKINISAERKKELLEYEIGKGHGYRQYSITASKVTQKDINYMVNVINKRLWTLEKKGLTEESNEYQKIEKFAIDKNSPVYNVNLEKGTIRVKSSTKGMSNRERENFVNTLRGILTAKTSTASGTLESVKQRYESFLENRELTASDLSYEKYRDMWKLYREKVGSDKKEKFASSQMVTMIEFGDFYKLTLEEMEQALDYMANYEYDIDSYQDWLEQHKKEN